MTAPDTNDWIGGQTAIAQEQLLLSSGTFDIGDGYVSPELDVSAWTSIRVAVSIDTDAITFEAFLVLVWQSDPVDFEGDVYSFGVRITDAGPAEGWFFTIPVRANVLQVTCNGVESGVTLELDVIGSARAVAERGKIFITGQNQPAAIVASGEAVGASATVTHYIGPFEKGFTFTAVVSSPLVVVRFLAFSDGPAGAVFYRCGEISGAANIDLTGTFYAADALIAVQITNTDTAGHTWSGSAYRLT